MTKPDHWLVSINGDSGPFVAAVASIKEFVNPPSPFNSPLTMDDLLPTDAIWITHPTNPSASTMQFRGLIYLGNELWQGTGVDYGVLTLGANDCVTQLRLIVNDQPLTFIPPVPVSDTCPGGTGPFFTQTIPGRGYFTQGYNMIVIDIGNTGLNGSLNAVLELHLN